MRAGILLLLSPPSSILKVTVLSQLDPTEHKTPAQLGTLILTEWLEVPCSPAPPHLPSHLGCLQLWSGSCIDRRLASKFSIYQLPEGLLEGWCCLETSLCHTVR